MIRRRLAGAPVLLTAYFVRANRYRRRGRRRLLAGSAILVAWMVAVSIAVHADGAAVVSTLAWLQRHHVFIAVLCATVAGMRVYRRRALNQMMASHSWTAALPVERSTSRWQAIAVESVPALVLACILAAVFASLSLIALFDERLTAPMITWAAAMGGVVLGAFLSYLLPSAKQEDVYEGSRYIPQRRRAETPSPFGSLSALGSWPVGHMFASASARPKTVGRVLLPVLLFIPMGSAAADATLAIGLLIALSALVILAAAAISVSAKASRWLRPLPLGSGVLARRTLVPALAVVFCLTAIESWFIWMLGSPAPRCLMIGVLTLVVSVMFTVAGSLIVILARRYGVSGRL